jgi:tRNA(Ile)-lysidine synthase TilS/MesJ
MNLLLLFSGGQDSTYLLVFFLFEKNNILHTLYLDHESQIRGHLSTFHSKKVLATSGSLVSFSFLNRIYSSNNEESYRFSRYQISLRLKTFFQLSFVVTSQNFSDILETYFLTDYINSRQIQNSFFPKFVVTSNFYFKPSQKKFSKSNFIKKQKNDKKQGFKQFDIFLFNGRQKDFTYLIRPIRQVSRLTLRDFFEKNFHPICTDWTNFSSSIDRNFIRRSIFFQFFLIFGVKPFKEQYVNFSITPQMFVASFFSKKEKDFAFLAILDFRFALCLVKDQKALKQENENICLLIQLMRNHHGLVANFKLSFNLKIQKTKNYISLFTKIL